MLRINKMTDYGMLILANLAMHNDDYLTAKEISLSTHVSLPSVQKLLKKLHKKDLVISKQGVKGGYTLNNETKKTTIAVILQALEGDLSITQCTSKNNINKCSVEDYCQIGNAWQLINENIINSLNQITLSDLIRPKNIEQYLSVKIPTQSSIKRTN
jgi:FeS assembly SUF system regulator